MKLTTAATIAIIVMIALSALTGCTNPAATEPVVVTKEVKVPVPVTIVPPDELRRPQLKESDMVTFVPPTHPAASSCLSAPDEPKLRSIMDGREQLLDGWDAFVWKSLK